MRVEGIDKLLRKLKRLGPPTYRPAIAEGAAHLKSAIATYPPRRHGPQPPKTMRQRLFLIYAIENGLIDVPYRRKGSLGRRWTVEFRDEGLTGVVGNNTPNAKYVQGHEDQSLYHEETGWKTDRQVVEDEAREVREIMARHIRNAIASSGQEAAR